MNRDAYDLYGYRNDNGNPPQVKTPQGDSQMSWWDAGLFHTTVMNTILLRRKFPDFFEMVCWREEQERKPVRVDIKLNPYQHDQVYNKGNAITYPYQCRCGDVNFVTLQPTTEICQYAPRIGYHELPPATFNSGPTYLY